MLKLFSKTLDGNRQALEWVNGRGLADKVISVTTGGSYYSSTKGQTTKVIVWYRAEKPEEEEKKEGI